MTQRKLEGAYPVSLLIKDPLGNFNFIRTYKRCQSIEHISFVDRVKSLALYCVVSVVKPSSRIIVFVGFKPPRLLLFC